MCLASYEREKRTYSVHGTVLFQKRERSEEKENYSTVLYRTCTVRTMHCTLLHLLYYYNIMVYSTVWYCTVLSTTRARDIHNCTVQYTGK